jgi:hypothetical protein
MGLKLAGIMMILMLAMGGIGYWYYTDTQKNMRILIANEAKATMAAKESEQAKKIMEETTRGSLKNLKKLMQSLLILENKIMFYQPNYKDMTLVYWLVRNPALFKKLSIELLLTLTDVLNWKVELD